MRRLAAGIGLSLVLVAPAFAESARGGWPSLVGDRSASRVGDSLTVLIFENASASNTARRGSRKATRIEAEGSTSVSNVHRAQGSLAANFDGVGQTSRSDQVVATISVVVDAVLPNGDLHVTGEQFLKVNGERTRIRLSGRVRPSDISGGNAVLSSRIADADIEYDGVGFGARSARPGLANQVLNWLGVL